MVKNKKKLYLVITSFVLIAILGSVTYAFFNYTRTGSSNTIRVGRIAFNSSQNGMITLTNLFPTSNADADNLQDNSVTISITGDTTYSGGIEYLVTADDVNVISNGKKIPVSLSVSVDDLGLQNINYFRTRGGDTSSYKILVEDVLNNEQRIAVGYIAPGAEGVNGSITIKAYIDDNKIAITDTPEENTEWQEGRTIISTSEWNSLSNNPISFRVKVEANEGIWVDENNLRNKVVTMFIGTDENIDYTVPAMGFRDDGWGNTQTIAVSSFTRIGNYVTYGTCGPLNPKTGKYEVDNWQTSTYNNLIKPENIESFKGKCISDLMAFPSQLNISGLINSQHKIIDANSTTLTFQAAIKNQNIPIDRFGVYEMSSTVNDDYPIYFFRGDHSVNNNVLFSGYCWKIVRTTELGGTRMIYNGLPNADGECLLTSNESGAGTFIKMFEQTVSGQNSNYIYPGSETEPPTGYDFRSAFRYNVTANDTKYVGFTYDTNTSSNFKKILDTWYDGAINNDSKKYVENSIYCNDKVSRVASGITYYAGYDRMVDGTPDVSCNVSDQYKLSVGFLTADDIMLSGRSASNGMQDYLYNSLYYWLGSPGRFRNNQSYVMALYGDIYANFDTSVTSSEYVRPVVSLKKDTCYISGDGSQTSPFIIDNVRANEGVIDDSSPDHLMINTERNYLFGNPNINPSMVKRVYTVTSNEVPSDAISSWDVSSRQNGSVMAYVKNSDTEGLYDLYIGQIDGVRTVYCSALFYGFANMVSADLSNLIVEDVINMSSMFDECVNLTTLNVSGWDTSNVVNMSFMFNGCSKLENLDLSTWDMSKVTRTNAMFQSTGFKTLIMPNNYTRIDNFMFNHNYSYNGSSFTIPATVTSVGYSHIFYTFGKDSSFTQFIVGSGSTSLKTIDGILYSYDGTTLISIPKGKTFTNNTYEMPEGVTKLNVMSFSQSKKIDKVVLPNSYVIDRWFEDTSGDSDPVKGNSLATAIYVFTSVKEYEVKSDNSRYSSDSGCIYSKDGTELIAVPVHYTGVLNIKAGTTTIGQEAFWKQRSSHMDKITAINIPASVTTIEANQLTTLNTLMSRSTNPVTITIDSGNTSYQISNNQIVAI